ncbi:MAG: tRNA-guanine transglycosylase [Oscillospiraceae bacterium]|nr:tRNA-guanine transglycosylase [Oscillospiraceae bacterium]
MKHGDVPLPAFFPDATYGSVRCVDAADLVGCGVPGLVMNCYHLLTRPGLGVLRHFGGARRFSGWGGPLLTDSGGFQVFSMIRENPKFGEIRKSEIIFRRENGEKLNLSPEKCIQAQFACGSDIMMCLDYCSHPEDSYELSAESVDITIHWAERCKREYEKLLAAQNARGVAQNEHRAAHGAYRETQNEHRAEHGAHRATHGAHRAPSQNIQHGAQHGAPNGERPLLFAIIQGGGYRDLRKRCAEALVAIGFDGYGFGGWPLSSDMQLIEDILQYTADLMPDDAIKYAMGVGKPENIIKCEAMGYNLFDCVIPTRDARHHRLFVFTDTYGDGDVDGSKSEDKSRGDGRLLHSTYYILDKAYIRDSRPVSDSCDCHTCQNYSRAYLHHLAKSDDSLLYRLATIHNLRFYAELMERLRMRRRSADGAGHG